MQVVFHLGAHCTDEDRLVRALLRNRAGFSAAGIAVPGPARYRPVLRETLVRLKGAAASAEMQETILQAVLDEGEAPPQRLIFSHELLLCVLRRVVSEGGFYSMAGRKASALRQLFPGAGCEFHLALRNPATLVPAVLERLNGVEYGDFMGAILPESLRWAPVIAQMRAAVPDCPITLWCNEDTPLVWPEALRAVAGLGPETPVEGELDLVATLMPEEAVARLSAYLAGHPPVSIQQRQKIYSAFLDKFARPEALEVEIPLPGWTEALVERMTADYEADLAEIAAMEGVALIAP